MPETMIGTPPAEQRPFHTRPLHVQVAELLRVRIANGRYKPGEKLPSYRGLCLELDISKATCERGVALLRAEGLAISYKAGGVFVADPLPEGVLPPPGPEPALGSTLDGAPSTRPSREQISGALIGWIIAVMRARIAAGTYRPGGRIPPRVALTKELDVSIYQVDQAMEDLIRDGVVRSHKLKGSFVCEDVDPASLGSTVEPPRPAIAEHYHPQSASARPDAGGGRRARTALPQGRRLALFGGRTPKEFGAALAAARAASNMTLKELAVRLAIPATTISEIENGYVSNPRPETLARLGRFVHKVETDGPMKPPAGVTSSAHPKLPAAQRGAGRYFLAFNYPDPAEPGGQVFGNTIFRIDTAPTTLQILRGVERDLLEMVRAKPENRDKVISKVSLIGLPQYIGSD